MKEFRTQVRTGGFTTVRGLDGNATYQMWNSARVKGEAATVEDFIAQNPPSKPSSNLLNAIRKAFRESKSVTYNCGNGNQTFYFSKSL